MKTRCLLTASLFLATAAACAQTPAPGPSPTPAAPNYIAQLRGSAPAGSIPALQVASRTVTQVPALTGQLFRAIQSFSAALWADPTQAQAIVDSLGERAAPLFVAYGEMAGPLAVLDPASYAALTPVPTGYSWTILPAQPDGTWPVGQRSVLITHTAPAPLPSPTP